MTCLNLHLHISLAGTDYVEYNADCCFTEGRKEAVCEVVLIDDGVCGVDAKSFNATLVPEDDQFACEDIAKIALKDECSTIWLKYVYIRTYTYVCMYVQSNLYI